MVLHIPDIRAIRLPVRLFDFFLGELDCGEGDNHKIMQIFTKKYEEVIYKI